MRILQRGHRADGVVDHRGGRAQHPAPPVPQEVEQGYLTALQKVSRAFTTFSADYRKAVDQKNAEGVLASSRALRSAVSGFDSDVRKLDLAPVQEGADAVLAITGEIVGKLDKVAKAKSGQQAAQILATLPFTEFTTAFTELATDIRGG